jgi:hypothetical protein
MFFGMLINPGHSKVIRILANSNTPRCIAPSNSGWLSSYGLFSQNPHHIISHTTHNTQHGDNMVQIVLVGFLPDNNGPKCDAHPVGCGNAFIERQGNGVGMLVRLCLVEFTHLAGYDVRDDGTDGCRICFAAREYATGPNDQFLGGALLLTTEVFLSDTANRSMRHLYHRNRGYAYADVVDN